MQKKLYLCSVKKTNTEIERKFLVTDDGYKRLATSRCEICQGYLCKDRGRTVRVRIVGDRAFLTVKSSQGQAGIARFEWEHEISPQDARELLALCLPGRIEKTRWIVPAQEEGLRWEIDEFHSPKAGLVMAEIELEDEAQTFLKPDFIGEEVTGRPEYYNANMI